MKLVKAVIREERLNAVLEALVAAGFAGATVYKDVGGMGGESGIVKIRGRSYEALLPRVVVEVIVADEEVDKVISVIMSSARTGRIGDGRIFILPVLDALRIRDGERLTK